MGMFPPGIAPSAMTTCPRLAEYVQLLILLLAPGKAKGQKMALGDFLTDTCMCLIYCMPHRVLGLHQADVAMQRSDPGQMKWKICQCPVSLAMDKFVSLSVC